MHNLEISYQDLNGCWGNTVTYAIEVIDLPTPGINGDNVVCENHRYPYSTEAGATNYDWQIVGGTIFPTVNENEVEVIWTSGGARQLSVNYEVASCPAVAPTVLPVTVITSYSIHYTKLYDRYFKVKLHLFLQIVLVLIVNEDLKNVTSFKRCRRKVKPKCT